MYVYIEREREGGREGEREGEREGGRGGKSLYVLVWLCTSRHHQMDKKKVAVGGFHKFPMVELWSSVRE